MTIDNINIEATLKNAEKIIAEDRGLSPATRSLLEILVLVITLMANRLNLNSKNSSKPPSTDPNRNKTSKKKVSFRQTCIAHCYRMLYDVENTSKVLSMWLKRQWCSGNSRVAIMRGF